MCDGDCLFAGARLGDLRQRARARCIHVTQLQRGPEVLGALIRTELDRHDVDVQTHALVTPVEKTPDGLHVTGTRDGEPAKGNAELMLVAVGVRLNTALLENAGVTLGLGDNGVVTLHRLLGVAYLPLGTISHKQGRVQVVKVSDLVAARTGLCEHEATAFTSISTTPRARTTTRFTTRRRAHHHPCHRRPGHRPLGLSDERCFWAGGH